MEILDAHIETDCRSEEDLENLAFFGISAAVVCAHDNVPGRDAQGLLRHFHQLLRGETARLRFLGIRPYVALGIHPGAIPRRGARKVLAELTELAASPEVVEVL